MLFPSPPVKAALDDSVCDIEVEVGITCFDLVAPKLFIDDALVADGDVAATPVCAKGAVGGKDNAQPIVQPSYIELKIKMYP